MSGSGGSGGHWHGPYHRKSSPTQRAADALEQERSSVLLGRAAKWSSLLSVKAYRGPLPQSEEGIEFFTIAVPSGTHPYDVFWYQGSQDVWDVQHNGSTFAMIVVKVAKRVYGNP